MTNKQKEAIEFAQNEIKRKQKIVNESKCNNRFTTFYQDLQNKINNDEILLNLIQTQQAEIEKKDKIIDLMAKELYKRGFDIDICDNCSEYDDDCKYIYDCIKEYFKKKVEE